MDNLKFTKREKLEKCYTDWKSIIKRRTGGSGEKISFHEGFIYDEEGYKYKIIENGNEIRNELEKSDTKEIGSGIIGQRAMKLLWACENLVDYQDIIYFADILESKKKTDIEKALYLLFVEENDKGAFDILSTVLKKKYALISYFFFQKDCSKYQVVRPNNFAERFVLLGAGTKYALNCSWENYVSYIGVLKEIQAFFMEQENETITLTDAHSFVWMLWMLENKIN